MGTIFLPWAGWQFRRLGPVVTFSTELRPTSPDKNKQIRKPQTRPPPTRVPASIFTSRVVHWMFVLPLGGAEVRIINLRRSHVEPLYFTYFYVLLFDLHIAEEGAHPHPPVRETEPPKESCCTQMSQTS